MLQDLAAVDTHPLAATAARYVGLLPLIPLAGFLVNGALSLIPAYKPGPSDPSVAGHGTGHESASDAHAVDHAEQSGAPGDDHHAIARHPFAGVVSVVGPLVLLLSFGLAVAIWLAMVNAGETNTPFVQRFFDWMVTGDLNISWAFQVDQLSMVMVLVITGVGTLIHIFSVGYMRDDPGYPRYFAYLNLFVAFMLVLVLGASYPVLFVGWEGVGLCSYLLIGFWFSERANADAGKKAFIVNRIGDFGFLIAMFLLFANLGVLDFSGVAAHASTLGYDSALVTTICLFFFLGCAGKSAQLPLYVWLPDAMAGPTPVSALIHAATMVTAGVYLIARSGFLFAMSPTACITVAVVGTLTALFAATIGLKQWDIKKVLAYSTISQLGYMFMGVGAGAYAAGMFHLVTHAFFKALLFLGSGSVIFAMHRAYHHTGSHEDAQDMRNMGGLRKYMPITFVLMWIATLAIAGVPPFSGFFSKDGILGAVFARAQHGALAEATWLGMPGGAVLYALYTLGLVTAFLTAIYMTRMMLYTFHGPNRTGEAEQAHLAEAPWSMTGPLVVLGVLSAVGGWLNLPAALPIGPVGVLEKWLEPVVGSATAAVAGAVGEEVATTEYFLIGAAVVIALLGIIVAVVRLKPAALVKARDAVPSHGFEHVLEEKYYVDEIYDDTVVRPLVSGSRNILWTGIDRGIIDNLFVNGSAVLARGVGWVGSQLQSGETGAYAWAIAIGALAVLGAFTFR
ncbi:MAG TPA: NADH-quinone oxidoreductase subunit L [Gemmatimonadaceae bacterium]|nr:NADH-quinone oxidoreductase subunit L [Gemmatimonadaceae bacterium]